MVSRRTCRILFIFTVAAWTGLGFSQLTSAAKAIGATKGTAGAQRKTCDPKLSVPVTAAMVGHKEKKLVLIDVRPPAEFETYSIPGSLNFPLYAIKTKTYLKASPIVLVNEGYAVGQLAEACAALNAAGFKAGILDGGLCAWKDKGGSIVGDPFAQSRMHRIPPRVFELEKEYGHQVLIDARDAEAVINTLPIPEAKHISLSKAKAGIARITEMIEKGRAQPFFSLVVMADSDAANDRIERQVGQAGMLGRVFFLEGGVQAYEKHLENIVLARQPRQARQLSTGGCKSCAGD